MVSAAAFSVGHLQQSSFGVFQLFIIGIAFGVAYQLTQDGGGGGEVQVEDKGESDLSNLYICSGEKDDDSSSKENNHVGASIIAHAVYNAALFTDAASNGVWPV